MLLKEMPNNQRPREKMLKEGPKSLSDAELLAIILHTGTKDQDVIELSEKVLYLIEDIRGFNELTIEELMNIKGIKKAKALSILACVEFARRMNEGKQRELAFINPESIFEYFKPRFCCETQENLYGIYLDVRGKVINVKRLSIGSSTQALVDPLIIFKWAVKFNSSSIILVHNHPSGDPSPSMMDIKVTLDLVKQAKVMGIKILDHIVCGNDFVSFRRNVEVFKKAVK